MSQSISLSLIQRKEVSLYLSAKAVIQLMKLGPVTKKKDLIGNSRLNQMRRLLCLSKAIFRFQSRRTPYSSLSNHMTLIKKLARLKSVLTSLSSMVLRRVLYGGQTWDLKNYSSRGVWIELRITILLITLWSMIPKASNKTLLNKIWHRKLRANCPSLRVSS